MGRYLVWVKTGYGSGFGTELGAWQNRFWQCSYINALVGYWGGLAKGPFFLKENFNKTLSRRDFTCRCLPLACFVAV